MMTCAAPAMRGNRHPNERSFQAVLTVAAEQQPCGVQVVEWVGLFAFSFQLFTRLAAVFAEKVGDFGAEARDGRI